MKMGDPNRDKSCMIGVDVKGYNPACAHRGYFRRNQAWVSPLLIALLALAQPPLMSLVDLPWSTKAATALALIALVVAGIGASFTRTTSAKILRLVVAMAGLCLLLVQVQRLLASAL